MNDDEIKKKVKDYGYTGDQFRKAYLLARDIERETRSAYFALIQNANNAANACSITAKQLKQFEWDCTHSVKETPKGDWIKRKDWFKPSELLSSDVVEVTGHDTSDKGNCKQGIVSELYWGYNSGMDSDANIIHYRLVNNSE